MYTHGREGDGGEGGDGGRGCTTTGVAHGLVVLVAAVMVVHPETNTKQTFIIVQHQVHLDTFRHHTLSLLCARVLQAARKRKFSVAACICCKHERAANSYWSTMTSNSFLQQH